MASNGLVANTKKTVMLFLHTKQPEEANIQIPIGKDVITQVKMATLLGLKIQDNQYWSEHIRSTGGVISSLNQRLYMLK